MSFRFLHAADLHLDTPFQGIGRISPDLRERLKDASLDVLDRLVDLAMTHRVRFVLLAGDLYDGHERGIRAQLRVRNAFQRLSDAGIDTFIVHGNHDPVGIDEAWSAIKSWPERVHIFSHEAVETIELFAADTRITISGISFPERHVTENLARRFHSPMGHGFHIALLHANLSSPSESSSEHANYSPCTIDDLIHSGHDYWALGHIHARRIIRPADPVIAYPGNTQGRSFKPSEQGPKGAFLVTVDGNLDEYHATPRFLDLGAIQFLEIEVCAGACADIGALLDALLDAAASEASQRRELILRARITGESDLYDELIKPNAADELLNALIDQSARNTGTSKIWWTGLIIDVRPERNLERLARRKDLPGELIRQTMALKDDLASLKGRLRSERAFAPWIDSLSDDDLREILDRAQDLALASLEEH